MGRKRRTDKHLPQRMYLRSGTYYFVEYGTNKWMNLGRDYVKAMAEYARLRGPQGPLVAMSDVIDRYIEEVAPTKATRTYNDNVKEARYLRAGFGKLRPTEIRPKTIYAYMDARGRSSETRANRELALLSHMFTKAIRWGVVESNPCKGVERFKEKPRTRYIEDWEYLAFKEHAGEQIAAYMDFKLITGLRVADILSMRLAQIQDDGIHVTISKTGKRIVIKWSDALRVAVERVRKIPRPVRGLHLFCTRHGMPYTVSGFSSIWQRKMKAAVANGVFKERFTDHDIRRKTASDLDDPEHAKRLLGHSNVAVTLKYYRVKPEIVEPGR